MGAKYTEAQKKASMKYLRENTDDIRIRTRKGAKEEWKKEAEKRGLSLNQFIIDSVEKQINESAV